MYLRLPLIGFVTVAITLCSPASATYDPGTAGPLPLSYDYRLNKLCKPVVSKPLPTQCELPKVPKQSSKREFAELHVKRGLMLFERMMFAEAGQEFLVAAEADTTSLTAQMIAARYQLAMWQMTMKPVIREIAEELIVHARKLAPGNLDVMSTQAFLLQQKLKNSDALDIYNNVLQADPDHKFARTQRAEMLNSMGNMRAAMEDYNELIRKSASDHRLKFTRGTLYLRMGLNDAAVMDLTEFIARDPHVREAYLMRAMALSDSGRYTDALADLNVVIDGLPDGSTFITGTQERGTFLMRRAMVYFHIGDNNKAVADALLATTHGGRSDILRLQIFLKQFGHKVTINGKNDQVLLDAVRDCFGTDACRAELIVRI